MYTEVYEFYVGTTYYGSDMKEDIEIEFTGNETEIEKRELVEREFEEWVWNNIDCGYQMKGK